MCCLKDDCLHCHRRLVLTHFSRRYDMMMVNDPRGVAIEEERNPDALDEEFDSNNVQSLLQEVRRCCLVGWCVSRDVKTGAAGVWAGGSTCSTRFVYLACSSAID